MLSKPDPTHSGRLFRAGRFYVVSLLTLALTLILSPPARADSAAKYETLGYSRQEARLLALHPDLYHVDRSFRLHRGESLDDLARTFGHPRYLGMLQIYAVLLHLRDDREGQALVRSLLDRLARSEANAKPASLIDVVLLRLREYEDEIRACNASHGLPENLIKAVIIQESLGDPLGVSRAGAMGLMQLMPATAVELGVRRPFNPLENICGGIRYLRDMLDRFNWDVGLALAAYNAGPHKVVAFNGIPPYRETRDYVRSVKWIRSYLDRYATR